jgi:AmmeMemoRadiSam system protein A
MAPTCSTDDLPASLGTEERLELLGVARDSIRHGLEQHRPLAVDPARYRPGLQQERAAFVTLTEDRRLRGCIGHLEACQALVRDVADNAFAAAFRDPRFPPLSAAELERVQIHVSVLSPPEPLDVHSERELLDVIRPGVDGLILEEATHRGTFLPSVWESLRDPRQFLAHLKTKAGLPADYWSDRLKVARYTTESFGEHQT